MNLNSKKMSKEVRDRDTQIMFPARALCYFFRPDCIVRLATPNKLNIYLHNTFVSIRHSWITLELDVFFAFMSPARNLLGDLHHGMQESSRLVDTVDPVVTSQASVHIDARQTKC